MVFPQTKRNGSALMIVVAVVALILIAGLAYWALSGNKEDSASSTGTSPSTSSSSGASENDDLELQNLGIESISANQVEENALREYDSIGLKGFYVFGDELPGGRQNPNFEFASIKSGTKIIAAADGKVIDVKNQPESSDYEMIIQPHDNSMWSISYDHLSGVSLKRGDSVSAGDVLGEAARQNNGLYRFEIQVNKDMDGKTEHICPTTLLADGVKDKWINELTEHQKAWESGSGINDLYDIESQNPVGCLKTSLTPEEAEGR